MGELNGRKGDFPCSHVALEGSGSGGGESVCGHGAARFLFAQALCCSCCTERVRMRVRVRVRVRVRARVRAGGMSREMTPLHGMFERSMSSRLPTPRGCHSKPVCPHTHTRTARGST